MSSLTNTIPFSLDEINLRKKLVFPDGTIQSTAYTGAVGGPTLAEVLADGNSANFLTIDDLTSVTIADGVANVYSTITQVGGSLDLLSGNQSGTVNSVITLSANDGAGASAVAVTVANAAVTVVPLLDVTSIRFPTDNSIQTQAPRFIERLTTAVGVVLTSNVSSLIFSTTGPLLPGSYAISGFVQNDALVGAATNIQYDATIQDNVGGNVYRVGFTAISTQADAQLPLPYYPISGFFRNTGVAGIVFEIYQRVSFTGAMEQTTATVDIYYLGA
jgi:hypothetical protein